MVSKVFIGSVMLCFALSACGSGSGTQKDGAKSETLASSTERMKPGMWEAVGGMIAATGVNSRRCVNAQEARTANGSEAEIKAALEGELKKVGCTLSSLSVTETTVTVEQVCSGAKLKTINTYNGDKSTTVISGGGMPELKTESRRVGDC